jgi:hypothetical protein
MKTYESVPTSSNKEGICAGAKEVASSGGTSCDFDVPEDFKSS